MACFTLHVLLYHTAAISLYNFSFIFYIGIFDFALWAVAIFLHRAYHNNNCIYKRLPEDEPSGSKHVEPLKTVGIINSITKLHLVGISTE
jgi:hypothetical protein